MAPPGTDFRAALRWLFVIQLSSMGAMEMSAPFWPLHLGALGRLSPYGLAWASSIAYAGPMLMAMCFTPWWGRLGDRTGHKPMLLRALLALAATQLWVAAADDVVTVLAARLAQGALAGFIAAAQAYGAGLIESGQRGRLMARLQVATAVGSLVGPMIGGLLFDFFGFRALNLVAASVCLACAIAAWAALPATRAPTPAKRSAPGPDSPFARSALLGLLLAIVLVQAGKMMPQAFFALFAQQVLLAPAWLIGLCHGATALGLCIAAPFWARRFEDQPRAQVLRQLERVCWACAAIVAVQASQRDLAVFVLSRMLWGICLGALLPVLYGLLSREAAEGRQGQTLGAGNSAAKAGALLGIGAGGLTLAWLPIQQAFWPLVLLYVLAAAGLRLMERQRERAATARSQAGA